MPDKDPLPHFVDNFHDFLSHVSDIYQKLELSSLKIETTDFCLEFNATAGTPSFPVVSGESSSPPGNDTFLASLPTTGEELSDVSPVASSPPSVTKKNTESLKSPIIGTFYRSPSPESPPFVKEGERVDLDKTVCIVEAMKMMNEIKAEVAGTVVKILKVDGDSVKTGDILFEVEP